MNNSRKYSIKKGITIILIMFILLIIVAILSINSGKMSLNASEVLNVFKGIGTDQQNLIIYEFRLPRIILAILVGIGMGTSGCILQSLLKNTMASPGTLGISSGSGLFVLLFVVFFASKQGVNPIILPLLAFIGGITAAIIIFALSYKNGEDISPTNLILNGVALSSGYGALTTLLTLRLDEKQMEFMQLWSAGSLWGSEWRYLKVLAPWIIILFIFIFYKSRILNTLNLGNQTAKGLGVNVKSEFILLAFISVAMSSASVALGGNFFFIGMIAPHMGKRLVGPNHKLLLPAASLIAAIIILLADTITRTISFGTSVPTGIIITILSTPYFLYLLSKAN